MAVVPPFFLDCVVAIGVPDGEKTDYAGTGFLYGHLLESEEEDKPYAIFLITNRHVLEGKTGVSLRFNPLADEPAREFKLELIRENGAAVWFGHQDPDVDIAAISINGPALKEQGIKFHFFQSDLHVANRAKAKDLGISEGDPVFALGFPMGIVGEQRSYVIVRQGCIARIRDCIEGKSSEFVVDAFVFPGNSGGPVVLRPEAMAIQGTKALSTAFLLGVVATYVPYRDVAFSAQTKRPRVVFEENSGLASVLPVDFIQETIERFRLAAEVVAEENVHTTVDVNTAGTDAPPSDN